jgi:mannose-6-phosphate isomerase-like protein (cupin superfamily)
MYLVHPDRVTPEAWEGGDFRTLLPPELGGALAVYLLTVTRSAPHVHETEDQVYIVQSGRGLMEVDGERCEIGPGQLVFIPRGRRHGLESLGGEPVTLYSLLHGTA